MFSSFSETNFIAPIITSIRQKVELDPSSYDLAEVNAYLIADSPRRKIYGHFRSQIFYVSAMTLDRKSPGFSCYFRTLDLNCYEFDSAFDYEESLHYIFNLKKRPPAGEQLRLNIA